MVPEHPRLTPKKAGKVPLGEKEVSCNEEKAAFHFGRPFPADPAPTHWVRPGGIHAHPHGSGNDSPAHSGAHPGTHPIAYAHP